MGINPGKRTPDPWYKYPYVWLIILFPASAVIAGIFTLRLAIVSDDGLVRDDYYKQGLEINRVLARDQLAEQYGLASELLMDSTNNTLTVVLTAEKAFAYPFKLSLHLLHATRAGFDQELTLIRVDEHRYQSIRPSLVQGKWHAVLEADDWRLPDTFIIRDEATGLN